MPSMRRVKTSTRRLRGARPAADADARRCQQVGLLMREAVFDWDLVQGGAWWNSAADRLMRIHRPGRRTGVAAWRARIHPEDRERVWTSLQEALRSRDERWSAEYRLLRPEALPATVLHRGYIERDAAGTAVRMAGVIEDRSEAREAEERLNVALWAAEAGTWYTDLKTGTHTRCPGLNRLLGLPERETRQSNEDFRRRVHPEDLPRLEAAIEEARRKTGSYDVEVRVRRPDGSWRWLRGRGRFIADAEGRPAVVAGAAVDTTERKRMEEELQTARSRLSRHAEDLERAVAERTRQLQDLVAELEAFSYTVAHDLRAPLRALEGYAELLRRSLGPETSEERRMLLDRLTAAAKRMDGLTRDVLAFSRIGRDAVSLNPVDLAALTPQIIEQYEALRGADVEVAQPLHRVLGHEGLLTQALGNLLGNAVKFVEPGRRPKVKLWTESSGGRVRVLVRDEGIGIEPEHRERIFKPFERLHPPGVYEGTGIGLAIVRKAAQAMGGAVGVESAPGRGSRFWLDLRAAP